MLLGSDFFREGGKKEDKCWYEYPLPNTRLETVRSPRLPQITRVTLLGIADNGTISRWQNEYQIMRAPEKNRKPVITVCKIQRVYYPYLLKYIKQKMLPTTATI
ncbi:hypothetical protein PMIN04_011699 [Paraphaeosphaeria minitans]